MKNDNQSDRLRRAFLKDHQIMTRGLNGILQALREGKNIEASRRADELDRLAGPHVEFEETVLYPYISQVRGEAYASQLYEDHLQIREVLSQLREDDGNALTGQPPYQELIGSLERGLEHVLGCGTLLSFVVTLGEDDQALMLEKLELCRENRRRCSEL